MEGFRKKFISKLTQTYLSWSPACYIFAEITLAMIGSAKIENKRQTQAEELANSVSHGVALLFALIGLPVLIISAVYQGSIGAVVGAAVFGLSMILLYFISTLYHAWPQRQSKKKWQILDHMAIYFLIAGTYTPFTLGVLKGPWGWTLLILIWSFAVGGVIYKAVRGVKGDIFSVALYIGMGWLLMIAIKPLIENMSFWGIFWLFAGGFFYTSGVAFYIANRIPFNHFIWHIFVMAGNACHFIAVLFYASGVV